MKLSDTAQAQTDIVRENVRAYDFSAKSVNDAKNQRYWVWVPKDYDNPLEFGAFAPYDVAITNATTERGEYAQLKRTSDTSATLEHKLRAWVNRALFSDFKSTATSVEWVPTNISIFMHRLLAPTKDISTTSPHYKFRRTTSAPHPIDYSGQMPGAMVSARRSPLLNRIGSLVPMLSDDELLELESHIAAVKKHREMKARHDRANPKA